MKKLIALLAISSLTIQGCATSSGNIASSYVSPVLYQSYNCQQISEESSRLKSRITQLGGRLDEASDHDKLIAGAGVLIFWPALFALGGTKEQEAEYAQLKGEYEAITQESIRKNCGR